ncbi:hypothetical protein Ahy_B01g055323 [Arachis hypogaea]|uniref:Uncharacterized protein n=1 Tax=Arachis hypogaea TaxID=3818 RepID=A0A445AVZ2_ARAHY|nr:hypothetical protein Ahy_B01g055323 [Arachis hypogaea]
MMIANTASYEETLTQEGRPGSEKGKSLETPILIKELEELSLFKKQPADQFFEKFETLAKRTELSADLKEKCYLWTTHVKTYEDGGTNE